jgi:geranylgeranyl pyrophosphate synthase
MIKELAILDLVNVDLKQVEGKMRNISVGAYAPLAEAFLQLLASGGKRLRPALALASYRLFEDQVDARTVALAAAVETLHNATLVHDDLIDGALLRRGNTTLNATWDKGATVLAGDYLFARAAGFAAETGNVRVVQLFADTLRIICEGELRQHFSSRQWLQPKDSYYARIFAKTASLFASATSSSAILAGATQQQDEALYAYGRNLGMAFQIVDDVLDYAGDESVLGKPVGGDLRQGIVTLPFFYYLQTQEDASKVAEQLDAALKQNGNGMREIVAAVRASGAIQRALGEAQEFADRALADLESLPRGPYWQALADLPAFVVARHV